MAVENERWGLAAAGAAAVGRLVARRQKHTAHAGAGIGRFDSIRSLRGLFEAALRLPGAISLPPAADAATGELPRDRPTHEWTGAGAANRFFRAAATCSGRSGAWAAGFSRRCAVSDAR